MVFVTVSNDVKVKNDLGERVISEVFENGEGGSGVPQLINVSAAVAANGSIALEKGVLEGVFKALAPGGKLATVVNGGDISRAVVSKMVLVGFLSCAYDIQQSIVTGWSRNRTYAL